MAQDDKIPFQFRPWAINLVLRGLLKGALALPYRWRVPMIGWITAHVWGPLAGYPQRIRDNLSLIWPDLPEPEVKRLIHASSDNAGRALIEMYSPEFREGCADAPMEGEGVPHLYEAQKTGRPVIVVSGHFGNYDAFRAHYQRRIGTVGAFYRPLNNRYFNRHYEAAMHATASPIFSRDRRGMAQMVKFLRGGGTLAMLTDQHMNDGALLRFFDKPARTALSAAELAIRYDAIFVFGICIRQPDGISFRIRIDAPIPHTTPEEMSQAINDALEAEVRAAPEQWLWAHRRWKALREKPTA